MNSDKLSKLWEKIRVINEQAEDESLKKQLEEALDMTDQLQEELKTENHNMEYIGIDTTSMSKMMEICDSAIESVGYELDDFYSHQVEWDASIENISFDKAKNGSTKTVTNAVIDEVLTQTETALSNIFEANGLDIEVSIATENNDKHLYVGNKRDVLSAEDVQKAIVQAVQERMKDTFEKLNIPELPDSLADETMFETIVNITNHISDNVNGWEDFEVKENVNENEIPVYGITLKNGKVELENIGAVAAVLEKEAEFVKEN